MAEYIDKLRNCEEFFWVNPGFVPPGTGQEEDIVDIDDAEARLLRFAPFIKRMFPEMEGGIIESPLTELDPIDGKGRLFLKQDSHLPISGSIKARGGIYEVLKLAETLAVEAGLLHWDPMTGEHDDYAKLGDPEMKDFFSRYKVAVGSTGNLGLSIGIISAAIGFEVTVHMSADARQWKKDLLRSKGVEVIEYEDDYSKAVLEGRRDSDMDPSSYFVDDEYSVPLFLGYAVAAGRLKGQLEAKGITVDKDHPMIVYVPCGVGGAPGGVCYGLKRVFKDNVHVFFCEPTLYPSVLLGMATDMHNAVNVNDFGLNEMSEADGLACASPSGFVTRIDRNLVSGDFTVEDGRLYDFMRSLKETEDILIEPSSCAAFIGPVTLTKSEAGRGYLSAHGLTEDKLNDCIQICWATGGRLVPDEIWDKYMNTHITY